MFRHILLTLSAISIAACGLRPPTVGAVNLSYADREKACARAQRDSLNIGITTAPELLSAPVAQDGKIVCGIFVARPHGSIVYLDFSLGSPLPFENRILLDYPHPALINALRDDEPVSIFLVGKVKIDKYCYRKSVGDEYLNSCVPFPPPIIIKALSLSPAEDSVPGR